MKIIDKTPFRGEDGSISFTDRVKATLKYGFSWFNELKTQDEIIPILEKHLGRSFILMRNVTLGGTEFQLPMVLIGPPVVLVINIISDQGVFRAKEDEWGTLKDDQIVPAGVNQLALTSRMGQVLQVFLDRAGMKGMLKVESVLLSAHPGTHIESVRPIVRVVMRDALERFAVSLTQAQAVLSPEMTAAISQVMLTGKPIGGPAAKSVPEPQPEPEPAEQSYGLYEESDSETPAGDGSLGDFTFEDHEEEQAQPQQPAKKARAKASRAKNKRIMGLSVKQLSILAAIFLAWLCVVIAFFIFINAQFNV